MIKLTADTIHCCPGTTQFRFLSQIPLHTWQPPCMAKSRSRTGRCLASHTCEFADHVSTPWIMHRARAEQISSALIGHNYDIVHVLNSFCSTDWLKTSDIVSSRSTLHYITLPYITLLTFLHFGAFVRFFPHIQIFSRLYNLPPRQAFWSSRRPDSLAITAK